MFAPKDLAPRFFGLAAVDWSILLLGLALAGLVFALI
jgi:hypothetical protein